jgi:hypothetical protein
MGKICRGGARVEKEGWWSIAEGRLRDTALDARVSWSASKTEDSGLVQTFEPMTGQPIPKILADAA